MAWGWSDEIKELIGGGPTALHSHAGGSGDMTKAVYDPNDDGVIAAAQLDTALATDAEVTTAVSDHAAAADPHTGYQKESEKGAANGYAGLGAGGLVPIAQLASGTPDGTKYLRDDGVLATPAGGGGQAFPIGSVFLAVVSTNPNTLLGYGTWSQIAGGKFLVGQTGGDTDFDVAEETGGAKTHTLVEAEMPAHTHVENGPTAASGGAIRIASDTNANGSIDSGLVTGSKGAGGAHNNVPPYFVVYIWKRTA